MHATSRQLQPLGSPAFLVALVLLVLNDFALKPLFHDWVTVVLRSDTYEALRRALTTTLKERRDAAFGERVTVVER